MQRSHELRAVAQSGRALEWGSRGRWFESNQPDKASDFRRPFFLCVGCLDFQDKTWDDLTAENKNLHFEIHKIY